MSHTLTLFLFQYNFQKWTGREGLKQLCSVFTLELTDGNGITDVEEGETHWP